MPSTDKDTYFLRKTFALARKAQGFTSPNPMVGAVIVKNGRIIASGYHKKAGKQHAEIEAIRKNKKNLKGATLYINLEPCCHFGKTPPCVDEVIKQGIKRVVIAVRDPNPRVCGKSIKKLKAAKVEVYEGLLADSARQLNEIFFKNMKMHLPFVAAKVAQSLDGKIATSGGASQWITQKNSRQYAKSLRDNYDAVLVGVKTVIADNPRLDGIKKIPFKIVIDPHLRIPLYSYLATRYAEKLIILASCKNKNVSAKITSGAKIIFVKEEKGVLNLRDALKSLYQAGIMSVFVEGGSETLGRFFDSRLVDKVYFFIAPKVIGGRLSLSSIGGRGAEKLDNYAQIKDMRIKRIGKDILFSGYPSYVKRS
ncbi:MAG: bifunctional diaminohydroxyphosphoribosylaminopyrimidine deaminase/5-amino-6-(5-phosphoribosylamino)uracil reductase RibD [Candidatus Omnitrophica bacterium]|nr:bifunctional diaminohydroxyphosphoribosylaminopyrimidine deaminase/5-amino-6-(5-phosphoribosylamino)uracil reductase RibD [Candidatus Omnitrophota bacterium]